MIKFTKFAILLLVVVAAFASFGMSQAADCRPGGSPTNAAGSCETAQNDLKCGGTATPAGASVYAGAEGNIEVCTEDEAGLPLEGRVGGGEDCQCIYADGGDDNQAPADGWARLDQDGLSCSGGNVSYNQGGGSMSDCG
jgi:hypothetical protein